MDQIKFISDITVTPIKVWGDDRLIASAAWLTTGKDAESATDEEVYRLLSMLMRDGHGSIFEFGCLIFQIHAPIFVFRQLHRHRIGWSFSEISGRWYRKGFPPPLAPVFWIPNRIREMVPAEGHKPTAPKYQHAQLEVWQQTTEHIQESCIKAWEAYDNLMSLGIAAEVARVVLPVTTYTTCRVQCNPRSLMAFLSKRVKDKRNAKLTYPQLEIQNAALFMELQFGIQWPLTHKAFNEHGRIAP